MKPIDTKEEQHPLLGCIASILEVALEDIPRMDFSRQSVLSEITCWTNHHFGMGLVEFSFEHIKVLTAGTIVILEGDCTCENDCQGVDYAVGQTYYCRVDKEFKVRVLHRPNPYTRNFSTMPDWHTVIVFTKTDPAA